MLQRVSFRPKKLSSYKEIINDKLYKEIVSLGKKLKGLSVLHINATRFGGGVAELLYSLVPLQRSVGVDAHWHTIVADDRLFEITKAFHNALQGEECEISKHVERTYKRFNAYNAHLCEGDWDIIVIHDPQPAAIPYYLARDHTKFILRIHPDTSHPNKRIWDFFQPFLKEYDAAIFTLKEYFPKSLPIKKKYSVPPAIDPLSPKNKSMSDVMIKKIVTSYGIKASRPLITQISRFDGWKDPLGVVRAYRIAKRKIPELQLVLAGSMATDDPEGWEIYKQVEKYTSKDPGIFLLTNLGDHEISALQRYSDIVLQKSLREGFGLTITEAMWKESAMIGGNVGGIKIQIQDGVNGFLVESVEDCAKKIVQLIRDPELKERIGKKAKESVRKKYLTPRLLRDHLKIYDKLVN